MIWNSKRRGSYGEKMCIRDSANIVEGSVTKATEDRFAVKLTSGEEIWAKADPVKKAAAGDGAVLIIRPENIRLHDRCV